MEASLVAGLVEREAASAVVDETKSALFSSAPVRRSAASVAWLASGACSICAVVLGDMIVAISVAASDVCALLLSAMGDEENIDDDVVMLVVVDATVVVVAVVVVAIRVAAIVGVLVAVVPAVVEEEADEPPLAAVVGSERAVVL
jgi:uncharacterized membrane protein YjgN (DUF898 family)